MIPSVKIETLMWSLPIVFMFHDFEKIIMFKPWINENRASLTKLFPKWAPGWVATGSQTDEEEAASAYTQLGRTGIPIGMAVMIAFLVPPAQVISQDR